MDDLESVSVRNFSWYKTIVLTSSQGNDPSSRICPESPSRGRHRSCETRLGGGVCQARAGSVNICQTGAVSEP